MKNIFRLFLPAILLMTLFGGSALAQTKIATVDMIKLFDNYYKTKLAQAALQDHKAQLDKDDKAMQDDLKKANDDYQQILAKSNDQAISSEERDRLKRTATEKKKQLDDRQAAIDQYERTAQAGLTDQLQHMGEKIRADIQAAVNEKAKAGGYTLVLNTAPEGINLGSAKINVPSTVVYSSSDVDLTAEVLKQLNAGAPIDMAPAGSAPAGSPAPSLSNTNRP